MPSQKRRRFQIRQRRKRTAKFQTRQKFAREAGRDLTSIENQRGDLAIRGGRVGNWKRRLDEINDDHNTDFKVEIANLQKRFPHGDVEVLNEACGQSSFASELSGQEIRITNSDLFPRSSQPNFHQVSVHDLVEHFGKNRFHLVVSTRGGADWGGDARSAVSNIYGVLKPGGIAFISWTLSNDHLLEIATKLGISCREAGRGIKIWK